MTDEVEDLENIDDSIEELIDEAPKVEEKMLPVSRVEKLVKKAKLKGHEQGISKMNEEIEALRRENESLRGSQSDMTNPNVDLDEIRRNAIEAAKEEIQRQQEEQQNSIHQRNQEELAGQLAEKITAGIEKHPGFKEKLLEVEINKFPEVLALANSVENTSDVLMEICSNPLKLGQISSLIRNGQAGAAMAALKQLSGSIKTNEENIAASQNDISEPSRRLQSSSVGADSGKMEIRDFRDIYTA